MHLKWPILKQKTALQTGFAALIVYVVLLCFQITFLPITFAIALYWLFYVLSFKPARFGHIIKNPFVWLWSVYYVMVLLGLIYTNQPEEGAKDVLLKITLFLWPLAFSSWPQPIWKYKDRLLQIFAWIISLSALCAVVVGVWRWQASGTKLHQLFGFLNIWPMIPNHYMALYSSFGVFSFIHVYRKKLQGKWFTLLGITILFALILATSVRIQLLAIPIAGVIFILFDIRDTRKRNKLFAFGALAAVALLALTVLTPSSRNRINDTIAEMKSFKGMVNNRQTNHRVFIWQYGAEVVQESLWLGTGTGAADLALHEKLKACNAKFWNGHAVYYLRDKMYNYHNAFLQHAATHGIGMFLLFAAIMFAPFFFKKKIGGIEAAFLALCILAFLTESMLERQAGVLFFGFFYNLFFTSAAAGRLEKTIKEK